MAVSRWQAFTGQQAVLEGSGKGFASVAAERGAERRQEEEAVGP